MLDPTSSIAAHLIGLLVSAALVGIYHVHLHVRLRRDPNYTIQALSNRARLAWVKHLMVHGNQRIIGVQTLRNHTMAAVFLASTAVLLIMGALHLGPAGFKGVVGHLGHQAAADDTIWVVRMLPLLVDLFWAFFCFSLSIRANNHVGYLIEAGSRSAAVTPASVAGLLNQGAGYYTLGMRAYYLAVPIIFGLFGPLAMVVSTLVILVLLYHADCAPDLGAPLPQSGEPEPPDRFHALQEPGV